MKIFRIIFLLLAPVGTSLPMLTARTATVHEPDRRLVAQRETNRTGKIDVNTASQTELEELPGVGPQTANAIIAARPFASVADLERVPGIGVQKLRDLKDQVTVGSPAGTRPSTATRATNSAKIDINTASASELESLPGVGPAIAEAIISERPFASITDVGKVPGIGPARFAQMRDLIMVSHPRVQRSTAANRPSPSSDTSRRTDAATPTAGKLINLNTASKAELESLPEIGPVKAQAIIDARPFSSKEDVMRVKGIKEGVFEAIRDRITVP